MYAGVLGAGAPLQQGLNSTYQRTCARPVGLPSRMLLDDEDSFCHLKSCWLTERRAIDIAGMESGESAQRYLARQLAVGRGFDVTFVGLFEGSSQPEAPTTSRPCCPLNGEKPKPTEVGIYRVCTNTPFLLYTGSHVSRRDTRAKQTETWAAGHFCPCGCAKYLKGQPRRRGRSVSQQKSDPGH